MISITYDGVQLQNNTYVPRTVEHESAPPRLLDLIKLARQDGSVIIDDTFGEKYITIPGILVGSSTLDLEQKIDSFKELISRKDKFLDIDFAGGTRRYKVRSVSHEFDRDFYHLRHVPYTVKFFVIGGIATDSGETTAQDVNNILTTSQPGTMVFGGSYRPKPRHKITLNNRGNADVVRILNNDTQEYMDVDLDLMTSGDYLEVDEENQTVKKNGSVNLDYRGKFPVVKPGTNNLQLQIFGNNYFSDGGQFFNDGGSRSVLYDSATSPNRLPQMAQSFVPTQSGRIGRINVFIDKDGTPGGKMQWHWRKDKNGVPDMTAGGRISSEEYELAAAAIADAQAWYNVPVSVGTAPFLKAGQKYWLFLNPGVITGTNSSNFYSWWYSNIPTRYLPGKAMANKESNQPWLNGVGNAQNSAGVDLLDGDYMFEIFRGDGNSPTWNIRWQTFYTKKWL